MAITEAVSFPLGNFTPMLPLLLSYTDQMGYPMFSRLTALALATTAALALPVAARAEPGGCVKGAVAGGVAGHFVGSGHGKGGAAAGCAAGMVRRHNARKAEREGAQQNQQQPEGGQPGGNGAPPPPPTNGSSE
ncbi:Glycine zipper domain-containing protein [Komagataeibacter xylinus]